jgi:hypothetical protein
MWLPFRERPVETTEPRDCRFCHWVLLRIVDGAGFANHAHFNLAGILHLGFDPLREVAGQDGRGFFIDLFGLNDDPDFTPGMDSIADLDTIEAISEFFKFLKTFDVKLGGLGAGPWATGTERVTDRNETGKDGFGRDFVVVAANTI